MSPILSIEILIERDGIFRPVRGRPARTGPHLYARACRAMVRHAQQRPFGIYGIAVESDHHALAWQRWNQAALRQIAYSPVGNAAMRCAWTR